MNKEKLVKEYVDGKAISALAREYGVSRQAIIKHLKAAGVHKSGGVTPQVTPPVVTPKAKTGVTPPDIDLYAYADSLPKLKEYDNGAGSVCRVNEEGTKYYFEALDIWLPVVRDEGPLKDHVEYLKLGKRFKRSHPHHPDNAWKRDPQAKHPYELYSEWQERLLKK